MTLVEEVHQALRPPTIMAMPRSGGQRDLNLCRASMSEA